MSVPRIRKRHRGPEEGVGAGHTPCPPPSGTQARTASSRHVLLPNYAQRTPCDDHGTQTARKRPHQARRLKTLAVKTSLYGCAMQRGPTTGTPNARLFVLSGFRGNAVAVPFRPCPSAPSLAAGNGNSPRTPPFLAPIRAPIRLTMPESGRSQGTPK